MSIPRGKTGKRLGGGGIVAATDSFASSAHRVVRVPSSAVISDARGIHVATVDGMGRVHLIEVVPGSP
jgi:hypothetical protein